MRNLNHYRCREMPRVIIRARLFQSFLLNYNPVSMSPSSSADCLRNLVGCQQKREHCASGRCPVHHTMVKA
jgi:hypothetical protein